MKDELIENKLKNKK